MSSAPRPDAHSSAAAPAGSPLAGKLVVLGMLAFGMLATGILWYYWEMHTRRFRPLQDAVAARFPGSAPRVDGGQRKSHKGTARILRFVMKVTFNPVQDEPAARALALDVVAFAKDRAELAEWEMVEFHFYQLGDDELAQRAWRYDLKTKKLEPALQDASAGL